MKTIKILMIGSLMLLTATVFSQDSINNQQRKPEYVAYHQDNDKPMYNENFFEVREAFHRLREMIMKQEEEIRYNPNEFVEKELDKEFNN